VVRRTESQGPPRDAVTTVMMPAFRAHATVRESVESVLAQTVPELELVVVDDASEEPIAAALQGIDDPRLRVLRRERNGGPCAARNTALATAGTPFVSQLDADDVWEPDYLESVLPHFDDPAIGLVYGNVGIRWHPDGRETAIEDPTGHPVDHFPRMCESCPIPSATPTFRAHAVRAVGGYPDWLPITGEYYLYLRLARTGWRFAYVHRKLATYSWPGPDRGISFDKRAGRREELRLWRSFVMRHPLTPGAGRRVRSLLARAVW
jgi:glycosyltransferase involved in cell wall biosynthesis